MDKDEIMDALKNFGNYLQGNPAMLEIWCDAVDRIEEGLELPPVQQVVVKEWLYRAMARRNELELESQRDMLSDEKYAELSALKIQIERIEQVLS
jgi:hypothetical protein